MTRAAVAVVAMALAAAVTSAAAARPLVVRNASPEIVTLVRIDRTVWHGRILPGASAVVADVQGCLHRQYAEGSGDSYWDGSVNVCDDRAGPWTWVLD